MADMTKMQQIVDAHGGWDGMSDDLYKALGDLKNSGYDWDKISAKSYSVLDTANKTASKSAPSTYKYDTNTQYEDLRRNVAEVGYSGLDDAQKKLFQSQFPASKFARAGGSFEDAVKYVDGNARLSKPMSVAEISPYGGMFGAPIPMTPTSNDKAVEFAKEHPGTVGAGVASTFIPTTIPGFLAAGGVGFGGELADAKLRGDEHPIEFSLGAGALNALTHGLFSVGGKVLSKAGGKIAEAVAEYPAKLRAYEERVDDLKHLKQLDQEAASEISQGFHQNLDDLGMEDYLSKRPMAIQDQMAAEKIAGEAKINAIKDHMLLNDPRFDYASKSGQEFGGTFTRDDIPTTDALEYWQSLNAPLKIPKPPTYPKGFDATKLIESKKLTNLLQGIAGGKSMINDIPVFGSLGQKAAGAVVDNTAVPVAAYKLGGLLQGISPYTAPVGPLIINKIREK